MARRADLMIQARHRFTVRFVILSPANSDPEVQGATSALSAPGAAPFRFAIGRCIGRQVYSDRWQDCKSASVLEGQWQESAKIIRGEFFQKGTLCAV